ncbi:RCC1 and BTB domain-containing protein 1-like isoform X1 [Halictus rubicundus]|uniref:RCC1 and BTB domain-containing protein 1-like isoform X1 n=1 Tax=Halictus rubicundus TaxID=77578 RepID=UPI004035C715
MTSTLKKWSILSFLKPKFTSNIRMVLVYGHLGQSCLIVTKDRLVYALGINLHNCLGTGDKQSTICPKRIDALCGKNIKTFAYGRGHVLALTENGKVYSWGSNNYYQLGHCDSLVPEIVVIPENKTNFVVDIACGNDHSMVLTSNGMVYAWGMCVDGQTGSGSLCASQSYLATPNEVKLDSTFPMRFLNISCGARHSVAVTCNGQVYSWGSNSHGQLGLSSDSKVSKKALEVKHLTGIIIEKVVCGCTHTLALSNEGILYSWGDNTFGQLGVNLRSNTFSSTPLVIQSLKKVLNMAASNSTNISVALEMGHQILMWGNCLGQKITLPTLISVDSIHDAFAFYASPSGMHQPFVISDEEKEEEDDVDIEETMSIMDHLMAAFDNKDTSDLTIEVQGKPIYVHKAILKIRSEYFEGMFQGDWKENNDSVLQERNFSYAAYRAFLKFLYTGKLDVAADNSVELLQMADFFNDDHLKAICEDALIEDISTVNVAFLYSVAVQYNAMVLKKHCVKFGVRRMSDVVKSTSFSELTNETMRNFITEADEHGVFKT